VTTPGHTADSISLVLPAERALLSGDMVLGRGTTVVAYPDGQLGAYFDSIERMRALDPAFCFDADPLADDEVLDVDGLRLRVVTTPGHTADSISLVLPAERALLSGDMVLGRGTTVVAYPDGRLGPYFESIERMRSLAESGEVATIWPAHGPVLDDALGTLDHYLVHRRQRLAQVEDALARLGVAVPDADDEHLPRQVVEIVYQDVDESLWGAAERSVRAQLAYLAVRS
jgi:glyoxylase-like metal-dependent hydrolase (beta-lactamase superfamily II)